MSKNDGITRIWTNPEEALQVAHWYWCEEEWHYCESGAIACDELFCLNDEDHEPTPAVRTDSLEGLV